MAAEGAVERFWDFSVRTYRCDGVPDACLSLQNDHGADVNMLLYCCWIGGFLGKFEAEHFSAASHFATQWADKVVTPLRSARTWMKHTGCSEEVVPQNDCMQLREKIKSVEFSSERLQQQVLQSLISLNELRSDAPEQAIPEVAENLLLYAVHTGIDITDDVRRKLGIIVAAAFPHWTAERIGTTFANDFSE